MLEQHLQFVLRHCKSQIIRGIHDENDGFTLRIVVLPECAVAPLARHIEHGEVYLVALEGLNLESDSRRQLLLLVLLWFQVVDHSGLS